MRLAYVNKTLMDSTLPAVNFTLQMCYALAEAGADVLLLAQKEKKDFGPEELLDRFDLPAHPNLRIMLFPRGRRFGLRTNQWFYLWAGKQIVREHRSRPLQAVLSRDPGALPYLARWRKRWEVRTFYQPHNFYVDLAIRGDTDSRNARKYQWLERRWIPRVDGVLCLLGPQAELYRRCFPGRKIAVQRPGLLRYVGPEEAQRRGRTVGYAGSLQPKKGVETLLRAFRRLDVPGARLLLVGGRNASEITAARKLVEELGVEGAVEMTGWLPYREVQHRLRQMAVGVLPLRDTFYNRYLTAPNKLFDYLSYGVPVVASNLPSIRDFDGIEKVAELVPPEDPAALARAIGRLLTDSARREQLLANMKTVAQKHLWANRARELLNFLEE